MDAARTPEPWHGDIGYDPAVRDAGLASRFFLALFAIVALAGAAGFLAGTMASDLPAVGLRCGFSPFSER